MNRLRSSFFAFAAFATGSAAYVQCGSDPESIWTFPAPTASTSPTDPSPGGSVATEPGAADPSVPTTGSPDGDALYGSLGREPGLDKNAPLSGVVAVSLKTDVTAPSFAAMARTLVGRYAGGEDTAGFPVPALSMDLLRSMPGTVRSVVAKWMDPLTPSTEVNGARFGANADFIAFLGEGWDQGADPTPYFSGSSARGWMWVNHEYISGSFPTASTGTGQPGTAPIGQHLTLAKFLVERRQLDVGGDAGVTGGQNWLTAHVDTYTQRAKREFGGTWMRVEQDPSTLVWRIDPSAKNMRFDSTSQTLARIASLPLMSADHTDDGRALPPGVAAGINGDCSGTVTPWGTIISAEENVQTQWGDVEGCWNERDNSLKPNAGCDPWGPIKLARGVATSSDFGRHSNASTRHPAEAYGYLVEVDTTVPPEEYDGKTTRGVGHKKLGAVGRARWENASFVLDETRHLPSGKPIVLYSADDRYGGRVYKFISSKPFVKGMSRADTRALLDEGHVYVAHFEGLDVDSGLNLSATGAPPTHEKRGTGRWIRLALDNYFEQAPNAPSLQGGITVGTALWQTGYNGLGGFESTDDVHRALHTAATKIGVFELNRPEDVEYTAKSAFGRPGLFVAFTKHDRRTSLDARGVLRNAADMTVKPRADKTGAIFVVEETLASDPSASITFSFFEVFHGTSGSGTFDAANPDNLLIDRDGGLWFGTDGNLDTNAHSDAVYYLDLDTSHVGSARPTFKKPFRVVAVPSDAEATGPAFTPDGRTLFVSVQHPGEGAKTTSFWPR